MIQPTDWLAGVLTITAIYVLRKQSWIHKYDYQWPGTKMRLRFSSFETIVSIFEDPRHSRAVKWKPYQLESPIKRFFDQIWKKKLIKIFWIQVFDWREMWFPGNHGSKVFGKNSEKIGGTFLRQCWAGNDDLDGLDDWRFKKMKWIVQSW